MSMHTVIMAGGAGTRLLPLTAELPKPLAPLCGAPIMDYTLRLLKRHGITQADATLWYRPRDVQACFKHGRHGVGLRYVVEDKPVGTAGSVLLAAPRPSDTVLVLSGDGLTDIDLTAALAWHKQRRAAATLVLKRVPVPLAYGVVVTDADGRITRFIEKPDWSRVISSLVNTGVYLLEPEALALIPADEPFDFGRELFPMMVEKGMPLYGFETPAYWCDVGNPAAFLQAQADLLLGKTSFEILDSGIRGLPDAVISADSYIAREAKIGKGAAIRRSCVLDGAEVQAGAQLDGAIVSERARVCQGAVLEAGSVLGPGSTAGAFSTLRPQTRVWPGVRLPEDAVAEGTVFDGAAITILGGRARCYTPAQWSALAGAFLQTGDRRRVAVMQDGRSLPLYHTLLGALAVYGAQEITPMGRGTLGMLAYAAAEKGLDGGLLCQGREIWLVDRDGLLLDDRLSAQVESAARRQELPAPEPHGEAIRRESSVRGEYIRFLAGENRAEKDFSFALRCADPWLAALARDVAALAGYTLREDSPAVFTLRESEAVFSLDGQAPDEVRQWRLCARALEKRGERVYDTPDFGWDILCDGSAACRRQRRLMQDGLARMMLTLWLFSREAPAEALAALRPGARRTADIPCEAVSKGQVLEALLADASPRPQGGLSARHGDARAVIRPDPALPLMHVAVSARDAEYAQELCDLYVGKVLRAMRGKK